MNYYKKPQDEIDFSGKGALIRGANSSNLHGVKGNSYTKHLNHEVNKITLTNTYIVERRIMKFEYIEDLKAHFYYSA